MRKVNRNPKPDKPDVSGLYDFVMECKKKNSISDTEMLDILVKIISELKSIDAYLGYIENNQVELQEQVKMINMCGF